MSAENGRSPEQVNGVGSPKDLPCLNDAAPLHVRMEEYVSLREKAENRGTPASVPGAELVFKEESLHPEHSHW